MFSCHPEPSRRRARGISSQVTKSEGIPRFADFAPMGLVRRLGGMLLQAGIPPRVGRNDGGARPPYFAPLGLVRRFVEMLLQAGISPRAGRNDVESEGIHRVGLNDGRIRARSNFAPLGLVPPPRLRERRRAKRGAKTGAGGQGARSGYPAYPRPQKGVKGLFRAFFAVCGKNFGVCAFKSIYFCAPLCYNMCI